MRDDGLEPVVITGRWIGFYRYRSEQRGLFPIVAEIEQTGNMIEGEMYDQITAQSDDFAEFIEVIGKEVTDSQKIRMELMLRHVGTESVRNWRLPDSSDIKGTLDGNDVRFTKTYRGAYEVTWTVEGASVASARREHHCVQYRGQLDQNRACLTGKWTIRDRGVLGWFLPPQEWGYFELYRKS